MLANTLQKIIVVLEVRYTYLSANIYQPGWEVSEDVSKFVLDELLKVDDTLWLYLGGLHFEPMLSSLRSEAAVRPPRLLLTGQMQPPLP